MVPTCTMIFEERSGEFDVSFTILDKDNGGLLVLERKRRWRMTFFFVTNDLFDYTKSYAEK